MAENIFDQFSRLISSKLVPSMFNVKFGGIGEKVLDKNLATAIYGEADQFYDRQRAFEKAYYEMISDPANLRPGAASRVDADLMRRLGEIDLSVLNYQSRQQMLQQYRGNVINIDTLLKNTGFPSIPLANSNPYRLPFKMEVDQQIEHPAQVVMNKMIFNIDPLAAQITDISFNTQNIMSADDIQRTMFQLDGIKNKTLFAPGADVLTLDIESTGLMSDSQMRSLSVRRAVGGITGPTENMMAINYRSPRLAGILAVDQRTGTFSQTLSDFIFSQEGASGVMIEDEQEMLSQMKKVFTQLNKAQHVTGHNIGYDIRMMIGTLERMPGYKRDQELVGLVNQFIERRKTDSSFIIDTLEIGRNYMTNLIQGTLDGQNLSSIERGGMYAQRFFSTEALADVAMGGKATYVGVENFALNSNLLDLMAREENASDIFEQILRGSHIAETDTLLQNYMLKYMHTGDLNFRGENLAGQQKVDNELINLARRTIFKSSAIVPTTNIADPRHLTQTALRYVKTEEGLMDATISISKAEAGQIGLTEEAFQGVDEGFVKYSRKTGKYSLFVGGQAQGVDIEDTRAVTTYLRDVITKASDVAYEQQLTISPGQTVSVNPFEKKIISLGVNVQNNSAMQVMAEVIAATQSMQTPADVDVAGYVQNVGNLYKEFGDTPKGSRPIQSRGLRGILDQVSSLMSPAKTFSMGFNQQTRAASETLASYVSHGQTMIGAGVKHGFLGIPDLTMSDMLSRATSRLAVQTYASAVSPGTEEAAMPQQVRTAIRETMKYASSQEVADITSQFGISHFAKQQTIRLMDTAPGAETPGKKLLLSYDYFKSISLGEDSGRTMADAIAEQKVSVGLSAVDRSIKDADDAVATMSYKMLNLTWEQGVDESGLTSRMIAEKLYEDFIATNNYKNIAADTQGDLGLQAAQLRQYFSDGQGSLRAKEEIIGELETLADRGIAIGYAGDETSGKAITEFVEGASRQGVDLTRDQPSLRMTLLDDSTGVLRTGPISDATSVRANRAEGMMRNAMRSLIRDANTVGETVANDVSLRNEALSNIKVGARKAEISDTVELYQRIKSKAGAVALGAAAMAGGYYLAQRKKETDLYDETLEQQPVENYRQTDPSSQYISNIPSSYTRRDSLATAGVVGNLDRRKIGHTQMGNNKYNHLYGGQ